MAQSISLWGAVYSNVPGVTLPKSPSGTATFYDASGVTAAASDVATGKYFITAQGVLTEGTSSGGSVSITDQANATGTTCVITSGGSAPSATQHEIYFEFSDSTDTTIDVYYDDALISTMITAYTPTTYGNKTVTLAQLDGVTWYEPANIPLNTELIDLAKVKNGYTVSDSTGEEVENQYFCTSDYVLIDRTMTFDYIGYEWFSMCFYDTSKTFISSLYMYTDATSIVGANAYGTLTSANIPSGAVYVRIPAQIGSSNLNLSLIRTA